MQNEDLGRRIAELLAARQWSQRFLEERAGLSTGYISSLLSGNMKSQPKSGTLAKIASAFGITVAELEDEDSFRRRADTALHQALAPEDAIFFASMRRLKEIDPEEYELVRQQLEARIDKINREIEEGIRRARRSKRKADKELGSADPD